MKNIPLTTMKLGFKVQWYGRQESPNRWEHCHRKSEARHLTFAKEKFSIKSLHLSSQLKAEQMLHPPPGKADWCNVQNFQPFSDLKREKERHYISSSHQIHSRSGPGRRP